MNFFKKALVATAVVASFGASAAVVSSDPTQLSAEGVSVGLTADNVDFTFDVVVSKEHPSSSIITITFDSAVDLDGLVGATDATGGPITTDPGTGKGVSGDVSFDYGTGSFTFDNLVIDTDTAGAHSLSWKVNLGNPLTANSAFRVEIGGTTVDISGASSIAYSSVEADDTAIETGTGIIAEEATQFSFATKAPWNGVIERTSQVTFVKNGDVVVPADADTVTFTITNDETLEASVDGATAAIVLSGDFDNGGTGAALLTSGEFTSDAATPNATLTGDDTVTVALIAADIGAAGTKVDRTVTMDSATKVIPVTGDVDAEITFTGVTTAAGKTFKLSAAAGEWVLDATIINVPYFPVGYTDTNSSIHFANESSVDADVIVTAIDNMGEKYGPFNLSDHASFANGLEGDMVTKLGQVQLMDLLKAPAGTKLSVTFNIDSDVGNVNAYAFSQKTGEGRQALVTSQQKGSNQ